ncbi:MAG: RCC1 domain-containing protein [Chloroflexota bacterium]|nr:RCC1 domain-containing protein [Chloroflexota bacterium]
MIIPLGKVRGITALPYLLLVAFAAVLLSACASEDSTERPGDVTEEEAGRIEDRSTGSRTIFSRSSGNPPENNDNSADQDSAERSSLSLRTEARAEGQEETGPAEQSSESRSSFRGSTSAEFVSVSSGRDYACGVRTDGSVACWGINSYGKASPPAGEFSSVSAGNSHTCGVMTGGSLACWGT